PCPCESALRHFIVIVLPVNPLELASRKRSPHYLNQAVLPAAIQQIFPHLLHRKLKCVAKSICLMILSKRLMLNAPKRGCNSLPIHATPRREPSNSSIPASLPNANLTSFAMTCSLMGINHFRRIGNRWNGSLAPDSKSMKRDSFA